jgi:hypothetical protein
MAGMFKAKVRFVLALSMAHICVGTGVLGRAQGEIDAGSTVTVCLHDDTNDLGVNLYLAKRIASSVFARVGLRIEWQSGQPDSHQRQPTIVLSLTSNTPEKFPTSVLAYAAVSEGVHIRIFLDHVTERVHRATPFTTTYLLAHLMVHEITHILEGVDRHSREGIMKARWSDADIQEMVVKPLSFAPEDIRLIRAGLAIRKAAKSNC